MLKLKANYKNKIGSEEKVKNKLRRVLMKSMFKMEELAVRKAPVDRGDLKENITVFPEVLSNKYVLTSKMPYSEAIEYGTRPFYAPIEPLKGWASRKLGDSSLGYAVRAKIAKQGIRAQPFMRPSYHEVKDYWIDVFSKEDFGGI